MKWNYTIYPRAHMESLRILVVGDVIHDVYEYYLTENRKELKSEFPGKWAYFNAHEIDALGGAANVAANIASIGVATRLVGVVGADDAGARIEALCEMNGIEQELVKTADRKTTLKMRLYIDGDFLLRRDYESASPIPNDLGAALLERRRILKKSRILPNLPITERGLRVRYELQTISHYEEATLYGSLRCCSRPGSD
jgi:bifunctional ADP-heptose synthase (sugar kinase/adenylyltransferase)